MKAVILAGGQGKRLGRLTKKLPKPLVPVFGKPVLEHQLRLLAGAGIKDVYILTGYLAEKIAEYCGSGRRFGMRLHLSQGPVEMNTADRVAALSGKIKDDFLLLYGDVMMNFDISRFVNFHRQNRRGQIASLVVHPNNHPFDSDLVEEDDTHCIVAFHTKPHPPGQSFQNLVTTGARILSPKIFPYLKKYQGSDLGHTIFPKLLAQGKVLLAYRSAEYFKDMGTPKRLLQVRRDFAQGKFAKGSFKSARPAVFLDRDGVLNKEVNQLSRLEDLHIYPFAAKAVRLLNEAGVLAVVLTNQPQIARGYITEAGVREIHNKLEWELGQRGAFLDAIYVCPHHKADGTVLHPVKKYAIDCECRKPKIGLVRQAAGDLNINLKKSFFIGNSCRDAKTAENSGVKFLGVATGYACHDNKFGTKKLFRIYKNVLSATREITGKRDQNRPK